MGEGLNSDGSSADEAWHRAHGERVDETDCSSSQSSVYSGRRDVQVLPVCVGGTGDMVALSVLRERRSSGILTA